jgi:glycosyltransferase involved in cell wall biosynthesis
MEQPLVSVIIPVYNMELFIAEAIESALNSDYPNFEIVIVNDGSTDQTDAVCRKFEAADKRVHYYEQSNSGASASRNNAISHAQGKYILPLDGDNKLNSNYISEAVKILETRPDVKLVVSDAEFFGEKTGRWELEPFTLRQLARKNLMDNCSMYRKADWESVGGYCAAIRGREDWDFWISLLKNGGEVYKLPIVGFSYRMRSDSKRVRARKWKKEIIDAMNARHPEFFRKHLGGPLRYFREMSRFINFFCKS